MIIILVLFSYSEVSYEPTIDSIISQVDSIELMKWVREISGEDSIFFLGDSTLILTRWYDTYDMSKAEDYLLEYFQSIGLEAYKRVYWVPHWRWPEWYYEYWSGEYTGHIFSDTLCYLVSTDSLLYYTTNNGYLWVKMKQLPIEPYGVHNPAPETLYIFSNAGQVYFSSDGGENFEERDSLLPSSIQDMYFITGKKGWILSNLGVVGRTDDAGMTWDTVNTGVPVTRDIFFVDSLEGWFCGYFGKIYHSSDGGEVWNQQPSPISGNFHGIFFMNADTGWICGDNGALLRTVDGGGIWEDISFSTANFREVYFRTVDEGWIGGTNGSLYFTPDGGLNWQEIESASSIINSIYESDNNIYIGGVRDFIIMVDSDYVDMQSYLPNAVCNIVAVQPGVVHPETTVIIGGHCDAVSCGNDPSDTINYIRCPGANNNGTGVGAVKEAAKILSQYNFEYSIEYVLWGAEESGFFGSRYYVDNAVSINKPIKGVIDVNELGYDTVGTYDIHIVTDSNGVDFAHLAIDIISLYSLPLNIAALDTTDGFVSDITMFWDNGYSGIFFENNDLSPSDWTQYDTVGEINVDFYYNFTKLALAELAYLAKLVETGVGDNDLNRISINIETPIIGNRILFSVSGINNRQVKIELYDIAGRGIFDIFEGRIMGKKDFYIEKDFHSGVYFIRLKTKGETFSKKVIILK